MPQMFGFVGVPELLEHRERLLVRPLGAFGLPGHVVRRAAELAARLRAGRDRSLRLRRRAAHRGARALPSGSFVTQYISSSSSSRSPAAASPVAAAQSSATSTFGRSRCVASISGRPVASGRRFSPAARSVRTASNLRRSSSRSAGSSRSARTRGSSRASRSGLLACARTRLLSTSDWSVSRSAPHDLLGRLERAAAARRPRAARRVAAPRRVEQVVATTRSSPAASAARGSASRPAREQVEPLPSRSRSCVGREQRRAGRGELERERQVVERAQSSSTALVWREVRIDGPRARDEELDCRPLGERRHRVRLLARDAQPLAARDEHVEVRARREQVGERRPPRRRRARSCRAEQQLAGPPMCSARPSFAPSACATVVSTSAGSRSGASGTHQTPSG